MRRNSSITNEWWMNRTVWKKTTIQSIKRKKRERKRFKRGAAGIQLPPAWLLLKGWQPEGVVKIRGSFFEDKYFLPLPSSHPPLFFLGLILLWKNWGNWKSDNYGFKLWVITLLQFLREGDTSPVMQLTYLPWTAMLRRWNRKLAFPCL